MRCRVIAIRRRKKQLAKGFTLWEMRESEVVAATRTEAERKRLAKLQVRTPLSSSFLPSLFSLLSLSSSYTVTTTHPHSTHVLYTLNH